MPKECVIVPLPTIQKHIRERGYDHIGLLARHIGRFTGCKVLNILERGNNAVQVGSSSEKRAEQAKTAYILKKDVDRSLSYLLLDDV